MTRASTDQRADFERLEAQFRALRAEQERAIRELERLRKASKKTVAPLSKRSVIGRLLKAALNGDLESVNRLLAAGADVNARGASGESALLLAVQAEQNHEVVRCLLEGGADPNLADEDGNTPLILAVNDEDLPIVRELVAKGAALDARNADGDTPLTNAAAWGSTLVVKYLISRGADPNLRDGEGVSPAELARQQGHDAIAELIDKASSSS
jgi:ankyrin repeat protein